MPAVTRDFTPAEAAALSDVAVKAVHNAIDKRIVAPQTSGKGASARMLSNADLLRLKLWYGVGAALSADRRKQLFATMAAEPTAKTIRADTFLIIDVAAARRQVANRVRQLEKAEALVHVDLSIMGGEPVFKGTRVPVRTVASMRAQGATSEEIAAGYPSLKPAMIELSSIWSAAHPARGRPRTRSDSLKVIESKRIPLSRISRASLPVGQP